MFDVIQEMAAAKCSFTRNFVRLSIKICRNSSTLTGTASKFICFSISTCKIDHKAEISLSIVLRIEGVYNIKTVT